MSRIFILLFLFLGTLTASADSNSKRLRNHITSEGAVYYVTEKELTKHSKDVKKFFFDVTYVGQRDSATVNFTVIADDPNNVVSLTLTNGQTTIKADQVELLYHEMKGKRYLVRTTSKVPYQDFKQIMQGATPVTFHIVRSNGLDQQATYSLSQWDKERQTFSSIFFLIND